MYKVPYSPGGEGKYIKLLRKFCKGGGNIITVGKKITWENGPGRQYQLSYNIEAVGYNIKWGNRMGKKKEISGKKIKIKKGEGGRISHCRKRYTPLLVGWPGAGWGG